MESALGFGGGVDSFVLEIPSDCESASVEMSDEFLVLVLPVRKRQTVRGAVTERRGTAGC